MMKERPMVLKALVGSHNYNLATPESDRDYKVFILPTFEDLYKGKQYSKQIITDTEDNDIHDVRKLSGLFYKANLNFLEVLVSNETIMAKSGYPEMRQIMGMKDEIVKMNLPYLYNACYGMHRNKMSLLNKGTEGTMHLVEAYGFDTKQALHAYRCEKVIVDFAESEFTDFKGALQYSGADLEFMMELRHGEMEQEVFEKFMQHYHDSQFAHLKELYHSQPVNEELRVHIEELTMQMVKNHITKGVA